MSGTSVIISIPSSIFFNLRSSSGLSFNECLCRSSTKMGRGSFMVIPGLAIRIPTDLSLHQPSLAAVTAVVNTNANSESSNTNGSPNANGSGAQGRLHNQNHYPPHSGSTASAQFLHHRRIGVADSARGSDVSNQHQHCGNIIEVV